MKIINRIITRLCGFVYSLLHTAHDNSELSIFFFFLTTSLFLGDGKQPFVDAWWALGILTMYGVRYYQQGKLDLRPFPRPIGFAWMALILYYIILIPFSDSAGYSVTATIRLIEAYLVYVMFVTISSEKTTALFIKGLLFVGVVASLASFIFLLFPTLASFLPPMNLLYATYGHNHLADLLLPIFPLVLDSRNPNFFDSGNRWRRVIVLVYVIGMLLTFARGAWILLILYLLFFAVRSKNTTTRKIGLSIAAATLVVFLFVSLVSLRGVPQNGGFMARIARQVQKPSLLEDGRWEYWRQAIEAIKERPLFGSGPGTFYLESKRLQARPSSYSWFAHSFPFEVTVETGVVGLLILTLLLSVVLSHTIKKIITQKHNNVPATPLFWGAILVFMYGLYEFNLDYAVIWLLVWAILGVLAKNDDRMTGRSQNSKFMSITALAVVVLFYLTFIGSATALAVTNNNKFSFWLAPYNAENTKEYLRQRQGAKSSTSTAFVTVFHRANADIYQLLIDLTTDESEKQQLKEQFVYFDPWKRSELDLTEYYIKRGELAAAANQIAKTHALWVRAEEKYKYSVNYADKQILSTQMLTLGDALYREGKTKDASRWYAKAQTIDAWVLDRHRPVFLDYPLSNKEKTDFFQGLGRTPGKYLGRYGEDYIREYLLTLKEAARDYTITDFSAHAEAIVGLDPRIRFRVWDEVGSSLLEKAKKEKKSNRYQEALTILLEGVNFWKTLTHGGQQVDWGLQRRIAEELLSVGSLLASRDLPSTAKAYKNATLLSPWVLSEKEQWFEEYTSEKMEAGSLVSYINTTDIGEEWEKRSRAYAVLFLVDKSVSGNDLGLAIGPVKQLNDVSPADYVFREKVSKKLQKLADQSLSGKKIEAAEKAILIMNKILPEDYWVQAQLGHFYVNTGKLEAAKKAYNECVETLRGRRHDDCFYGLQALEAGRPNAERYWQVSQIIQGQASWQDF